MVCNAHFAQNHTQSGFSQNKADKSVPFERAHKKAPSIHPKGRELEALERSDTAAQAALI